MQSRVLVSVDRNSEFAVRRFWKNRNKFCFFLLLLFLLASCTSRDRFITIAVLGLSFSLTKCVFVIFFQYSKYFFHSPHAYQSYHGHHQSGQQPKFYRDDSGGQTRISEKKHSAEQRGEKRYEKKKERKIIHSNNFCYEENAAFFVSYSLSRHTPRAALYLFTLRSVTIVVS